MALPITFIHRTTCRLGSHGGWQKSMLTRALNVIKKQYFSGSKIKTFFIRPDFRWVSSSINKYLTY
jgi:hypothetical protein